MRTVRVGLIGLGTVGSGVVEILRRHGEDFRRRAGVDIELARFADRNTRALHRPRPSRPSSASADWHDVIDDPTIDIVIELIGGTGVAREVVLAALNSGKSVVTANKALLASHGEEVMQAAEANGVDVLFEASVGGGIPIIGPLKHSLTSNEIQTVMGIVNGTTNYMLTRMADGRPRLRDRARRGAGQGLRRGRPDRRRRRPRRRGQDRDPVLDRVQQPRGHEPGPRRGHPRARPGGHRVRRRDGLHHQAARDRRAALPSGIDVRVHPTMIPDGHPLASVNGVYNAIYVVGDAVGETMFFGEGAGSLPAASAVVGDLIEEARRIQTGCAPLVGCTCTETLPVRDIAELETEYYVRLAVADQPGVLAAVATVFGDARRVDRLGHPEARRGRRRRRSSTSRTSRARPTCARRSPRSSRSTSSTSIAAVIRVEEL